MFPVNFAVVFIGVCPSSPINRKRFFFSVPANSPMLDFFDSFSEMDMDAMHLPVYFVLKMSRSGNKLYNQEEPGLYLLIL